jgi:hypothetical protein
MEALRMTEEEFCNLEELIKALITDMGSEHIEDSVRYNALRDEFVNVFIFGDHLSGKDI